MISISPAEAGGTVGLLATFQVLTVDNIYGSPSNIRHFIFLLSQKNKKEEMESIHAN